MTPQYPTSLDSTDKSSFGLVEDGIDTVLADHVNSLRRAIVALEEKVGIDDSSDTSSIDYKTTQAKQLQFIFPDAISNPILEPDQYWEGSLVERMVVLIDSTDSTVLHGWYTANPTAAIGYAMSSTKQHYPMEGIYESSIRNLGAGDLTGFTITADEFSIPTGTSYAIQYRSSATASGSGDAFSKDWIDYSGSFTPSRYLQVRLKLRTLDPNSTPIITKLVVSKTGNTWNMSTTDSPNRKENINTTIYGKFALSISQLAYQWTKYWNNPVMTSGSGWRSSQVSAGGVIKDGSTYKMWLNGHDGSKWRLGYATSTDRVTWTYGNGDAAIDFYGDSTLDACVDPTVIKDSDGYNIFMWHEREGALVYSVSTNGITSWSTPVIIYPASDNIQAISTLKIGGIYHHWWEESFGGVWRLMHGTSTSKSGTISNAELAVPESNVQGHWREVGSATPWFIYDGKNVIGFVKGFVGNVETIVSCGMVPEPTPLTTGTQVITLRSQLIGIDVEANNTYVGKGLILNLPYQANIRGIIVSVGDPYAYTADGGTVSGDKTIQVAVGTTSADSNSDLSDTRSDVMNSSSFAINTGGIIGTLSTDYAVGYFSGVSGLVNLEPYQGQFLGDGQGYNTPYVNIIAKAATVSGGGTKQIRCRVYVQAIVDYIPYSKITQRIV